MTHKLMAAIQVGPHRYGLYSGDKGIAWFGPPGEILEILHKAHVVYDVLGPKEKADYEPDDWAARASFCADALGGYVIMTPRRRPAAPELKDREYKAQGGQQVPRLRHKSPEERGPVDPDSLVAALFWDRLAPPDPIDQPQAAWPAEKGGPGSGNWAHRGRPGRRGGSAAGGAGPAAGERGPRTGTQVGITSHRAGRTPAQAKAAGDEWRRDLEATTARNVKVQMGMGGYEGGREPTYVTTYEGNGEALKAAARFGKKYNQDAVIVQKFVTRDTPGAEPMDELSFSRALTTQQIRAAENIMGTEGIGGWTWSRGSNGNTRLQMTFIPDWADYNRDTHSHKVDRIRRYLAGAGTPVNRFTDWVKTTIMYKDTYDGYASGELKALLEKGGPGSGNWAHQGRPGRRGGSAAGGGKMAFSKEVDAATIARWRASIDTWEGKRRGIGKNALYEIENFGAQALTVEVDGELKGIAALYAPRERYSIMDDAYIMEGDSVTVPFLATGERGYGAGLMRGIAEIAAQHDAWLSFNATDESLGFYQKIGLAHESKGIYLEAAQVKEWLAGGTWKAHLGAKEAAIAEPASGVFIIPASEEKGGPGSGNWGHRGRPGIRGGSTGGTGGAAQRVYRYIHAKRQAAMDKSPAARAVDTNLKAGMRAMRPDADQANVDHAAEMLHDVLQMDKNNWDRYAAKYGLTEDQKDPYYKAVGQIDRDMVRLEQQVKDDATAKDPRTGKPVFLAYNDPAKEAVYEKLVGADWQEAETKIADKFGVKIVNGTYTDIDPDTRHYNASVIYNVASDNPVIAQTMRGESFKGISYVTPKVEDGAWASWDGERILIKGNGYGDNRSYDMPPGIFIHESGHAFEAYAKNAGLLEISTMARTFGMGKMVSGYSWKSDSEDFAEHFLTIVSGRPDHNYAQHSPVKTKFVSDLITEALK